MRREVADRRRRRQALQRRVGIHPEIEVEPPPVAGSPPVMVVVVLGIVVDVVVVLGSVVLVVDVVLVVLVVVVVVVVVTATVNEPELSEVSASAVSDVIAAVLSRSPVICAIQKQLREPPAISTWCFTRPRSPAFGEVGHTFTKSTR